MNPTQFYKSIADETRLRCLLLIHTESELCVCELTAALKEGQPKVSRHLAQLRASNILVDRRHKQWIFYRINSALPHWALEVLNSTLNGNLEFIDQNLKNLRSMGDRPDRQLNCC